VLTRIGSTEIVELRAAGAAWMGVSDGYVVSQKDQGRSKEEVRQLQFAAGDAAMVGQRLLYVANMIEKHGMGYVPIGIA